MKKSVIAILATLLSACAVGPLVSHESARTVGKSNHELLGGYGQTGYVFKWNYGFSENFDLGLQWESLSLGIRGKYAFFNRKQGWSWAAALGAGKSVGGTHYYVDGIGSYMTGSWEPYGTLRIVQVTTDPVEFRSTSTGQLSFAIASTQYTYGQTILGTKYWFTEHWWFSIEATSLFSLTSDLRIGNSALFGAGFGYRF